MVIKATNSLFRGDAMKLLYLSALQHDVGHTLRLKKLAEYFCCYKKDTLYTVNVYSSARLPKKTHKMRDSLFFMNCIKKASLILQHSITV